MYALEIIKALNQDTPEGAERRRKLAGSNAKLTNIEAQTELEKAYAQGKADGVDGEVESGVTFPDPELSEAYDRGVNSTKLDEAQASTALDHREERNISYYGNRFRY